MTGPETPEGLLLQADIETAGHWLTTTGRLQQHCDNRAGLLALAVLTGTRTVVLVELATLLTTARQALALANARQAAHTDRVVAAQCARHAEWASTAADIAALPTTEKD